MADTRMLSLLCRTMYTMLDSGMDVKSAFIVERDENIKGLSSALERTYIELEAGKSLSEAMRADEKTYTPELVNAVYVTEQAGDPAIAFHKMADRFDAKAKLERRLKRACIYPSFVFSALIISMLAVAAVSGWLKEGILAVALIALVFAVVLFLRCGSGRLLPKDLILGNIFIRMPVAGSLIFEGELSDLAGNLALFYSCGILPGQALTYCAKSVRYDVLYEKLVSAASVAAQGQPLSYALSVQDFFPVRFIDMIKTGEASGNMEAMLKEAEEYYRFEVQRKTENLMALFRV